MTSLIDNVLALEEQADRILADARKAAENTSHAATDEIARQRSVIDAETEARIKSQCAAIEERLAAELAEAQTSHATALVRLDQVASQVVPRQAGRIVQAFLED